MHLGCQTWCPCKWKRPPDLWMTWRQKNMTHRHFLPQRQFDIRVSTTGHLVSWLEVWRSQPEITLLTVSTASAKRGVPLLCRTWRNHSFRICRKAQKTLRRVSRGGGGRGVLGLKEIRLKAFYVVSRVSSWLAAPCSALKCEILFGSHCNGLSDVIWSKRSPCL